MFRSSAFVMCSLFVFHCVTVVALADNWPAWRGPTGQGHCAETNLPTKWSATENVKWKIELPAPGNSTPIVWGEKIFLTQANKNGTKRSLMCLSRKDGAKQWEKTVEFSGKETLHNTNTYCAASPVTDGEMVVVSHGSAGVYCYDLAGKELWNRDFGPCDHIWGSASSPLIHKDLVFLNFGPGPNTFLIAMEKATGKTVWKHDEIGKQPKEYFGSWSTPLIVTSNDRTELLMSWPGEVKSHDPETGKVLWSCAGLEKDGSRDRLTYTSPLASEDGIFAAAGFGGAAIAIKPGGTGDVTETHRLWREAKNPQRIGSGVIVGDHVYIVNQDSVVCVELKTGKEVWNQRFQGRSWTSIVHADGKLYVITERGETYVFAAKPELDLISRNQLDGAVTRASIVPSNGEFLIRTYTHLWCIGTK